MLTFHNRLYKGKPAPLICWDFVSDYLHNFSKQLEDSAFLEKYLCAKTIDRKEDLLKRIKDCDALILTDIDSKILWVSSGFQSMTGYPAEEAIGRNPGFLQGENTDRKALEWVGQNLKQFNSVTADLVNYRKDGSDYLCKITIEPVFDHNYLPVNFLAFEKEL
jgi:PAS domain S-box-containing protein